MTATSPRDRTVTRQYYRTPPELREAVEKRFGQIIFDLAATDGHEIVPLCRHFTPEEDSLAQPWPTLTGPGVLWLNPPFKNIAAWAAKCAAWRGTASPGALIALLVPLSGDSHWWHDSVRGKAIVYALAPRVTFVGESQGFPKPLALCIFDTRHAPASTGIELWRWK